MEDSLAVIWSGKPRLVEPFPCIWPVSPLAAPFPSRALSRPDKPRTCPQNLAPGELWIGADSICTASSDALPRATSDRLPAVQAEAERGVAFGGGGAEAKSVLRQEETNDHRLVRACKGRGSMCSHAPMRRATAAALSVSVVCLSLSVVEFGRERLPVGVGVLGRVERDRLLLRAVRLHAVDVAVRDS
jgi:hypothetical protein